MKILITMCLTWYAIGLLTSLVIWISNLIRKMEMRKLEYFVLFLIDPFAGLFWTALTILTANNRSFSFLMGKVELFKYSKKLVAKIKQFFSKIKRGNK